MVGSPQAATAAPTIIMHTEPLTVQLKVFARTAISSSMVIKIENRLSRTNIGIVRCCVAPRPDIVLAKNSNAKGATFLTSRKLKGGYSWGNPPESLLWLALLV